MSPLENTIARVSRRRLLQTIGAVAGTAIVAPRLASAQSPQTIGPPSTVTNPPRDFGPNAPPTTYFTDPDILVVDPAFGGLVQVNSSIKRLWTGALWAEGPAWNGVGRYLDLERHPEQRADCAGSKTMADVTVFRNPSNNSNGNTFDFQGRQLSCEHLTRRVVRYEHDGSITVIADAFEGKRLNSPERRRRAS